jgi:type IV pilus assembly protein PilC
MYIYDVKGINYEGKLLSIKIIGDKKKNIEKTVRERGLFPLSIEFSKKNFEYLTKIKKINPNEIIHFNRELYSLLRAGIPLLKSLKIINSKVENPYFKLIMEDIISNVEKGKSLSESVDKYPNVFGSLYAPIINSGEKSGKLVEVIEDYNRFLKKTNYLKKKIMQSLIYPSFVASFAIIVFIFILTFIIPRFAEFYKSFNAELPFLTSLTISLGNFMKKNIIFIILSVVFIIIFLKKLTKREKFKIIYDRFKLKLPFGSLIRDFYISIYSRSLSLLLEGGVTIVKSIDSSLKAIKNLHLYKLLEPVSKRIIEGDTLSDTFEKTGIFPSSYLEIVKVGENSGSISEMLREATDYLDEKIEETITSLISFIEPAIIIGMGILIAGLLISVYLPIFSIAKVVH